MRRQGNNQGNNRRFKFSKKWLVFIASIASSLTLIIVALINLVGQSRPIDININFSSPPESSNVALDGSDIHTDSSDESQSNSTNNTDIEFSSSNCSQLNDSTRESEQDTSSKSSSSSSSSTTSGDINTGNSIPFIDGEVELFSFRSGVAYINKNFLSKNYIGYIDGDNCVDGWALEFTQNEKSFVIFVLPIQREIIEQNGFQNCFASYFVNTKEVETFSEKISASLTEEGDLQIKFDIENVPFNLIYTDTVSASVHTQKVS